MAHPVRRAEWQAGGLLIKFLLIVLVLCWPLAIRPMWLGITIEVVWIVGPIAALAYWIFRVGKKKPKKTAVS